MQFLNVIVDSKKAESVFEGIAQKLFFEYELVVGESKYDFCEIEFYYYATGHEDLYVHKNERQLSSGEWYFHGSGIDITFGKEPDTYGGILIRGLKKQGEKDTFISGPLNVAKEIFKQFGSIENHVISIGIKERDQKRSTNNKKGIEDFAASTRINLPKKNNDGGFIESKYRFLTHINSKHRFVEKEIVAENMRKTGKEIDTINDLFDYKILKS